MSATRRLFMTAAEGAVLFTVFSWALVLALGLMSPRAFTPERSIHSQIIGILVVVFVPDSLAAWWLFRRVRTNRSRADARRAATAFAVSAPVVLAIIYPLGLLVGGYAEAILGIRFILPAVASFILVLMIFVPSAVVMLVLYPSGGVGAVAESDQDEHC
jgi:hypothetical protein